MEHSNIWADGFREDWPFDDDLLQTAVKNALKLKENAKVSKAATKSFEDELSDGVLATVTPHVNSSPEVKENFLFNMYPERLSDNPHGLIKFHITSPMFEEFFRSRCPDKEQIDSGNLKEKCFIASKLKKLDGSPIHLMRINQPIMGMHGKHTDDLILSDFQTPNMHLLTAVGLKDGIDFVSNQTLSRDVVQLCIDNFYKNAKIIFANYIKQCSCELEVRIRELV